MDYFVSQDKSFIRHVPGEFPSFICTRDIAKAITELLEAPVWNQITYVAGEFASSNDAVKILEECYGVILTFYRGAR
ncbi:hypothetical protein BDV12DRAFT_202304 [Aspergillus spectabilis]